MVRTVGKTLLANSQKTVQNLIINRCCTTQGKHSVLIQHCQQNMTLALCTIKLCTSISTRGGWVFPGGRAWIIRHSLPGQIGVTKSASCWAYTLRTELMNFFATYAEACQISMLVDDVASSCPALVSGLCRNAIDLTICNSPCQRR